MTHHPLIGVAKRSAAAAVGPLLLRLDRPPTTGRLGRITARQIRRDSANAGPRGRRAISAVRRMLLWDAASARVAISSLSRGVPAEERRALLEEAVSRHADAGLHVELARLRLSTGDRVGAARQLAYALEAQGLTSVASDALSLALVVGDSGLLEQMSGVITSRGGAYDPQTTGRLRTLRTVAAVVVGQDCGRVESLAHADPDVCRVVVQDLLRSGRMVELRRLAAALPAKSLDASTASRVGFALRQAGDLTVSTQLAADVLARRPEDNRARRLLEVGRSGLALLGTGWEPPAPRARQYPARSKSLGYLLHNSLPHASAGYATRTHGLLSALHKAGWGIQAATRLGYPYDQRGHAELGAVPPVDVVDEINYFRLLDQRTAYLKWPLDAYLSDYADRVEDLARRHRLSILHGASNYWNGLAAVTAARRLGLPSVYEVRGLWEITRMSREPEYRDSEMYALTAALEAQACRGADHVLAITHALKNELVGRGVPSERITVLPNGVDSKRFTPLRKDLPLEEELGLAGKTVIGYVGSVLDYEGLDLLLAAAARLRLRRSDFHVLIVGDGAAMQGIRNLADRERLNDVVTFTGRVPHREVERYYSLIDIAPFPRKPLPVCEMVSPLKPFEAMAMGKLVVAADVAALKEIVAEGETGLTFTKGDASGLAAVLESALSDPGRVRSMQKNAREWVVAERDWSVLVKTLMDVYGAVLDDRLGRQVGKISSVGLGTVLGDHEQERQAR